MVFYELQHTACLEQWLDIKVRTVTYYGDVQLLTMVPEHLSPMSASVTTSISSIPWKPLQFVRLVVEYLSLPLLYIPSS